MSTVQVKEAGEASVLPAVSVARTSKVCGPSPRAARVLGLMQEEKPPASIWHWKELPPEKLKVGVLSLSGSGGETSMEVTGAAVSMVTGRGVEATEVLPAASLAVAVMERTPSLRAELVMDQLPAVAVVVPMEVTPSNSSTVESASAVPLKVGVVSLVMSSVLEAPESLAGSRSGVDGAAGALVSTVQVKEAGEASVLAASSVARTSNVRDPSASPSSVCELVQGVNPPPSSWHSKVRLPGRVTSSVPVNVNVAEVELDGSGGPEVILVSGGVVSGAVVSIVQVWEAGVASVLPAVSVARTSKVWEPSARASTVWGLEQEAKPPASSWHSKVEDSLAEKVKVASAELEGSAGPESMVVSGSVVSTVQVWEAGVASVLPAGSVAWTSKVWAPSARASSVWGLEQEAKPPASSWHSKVEDSLAEKLKVAEEELEGSAGPESMVVTGSLVSIVTAKVGEAVEALPAASVAVAVMERPPSLRVLVVTL